MIKSGPSLISIISVFALVSCQSGGGSIPECVDGFVKVKNICRSTGSLSGDDLFTAKMRLTNQLNQNEGSPESQIAALKMIEKIQETEAATRQRQQISEREDQERRDRNKVPVQHLQQKTLPQSSAMGALRNELRDSFKNEYRSKLHKVSN